MKEETALRKEKEAYAVMYMYKLYKDAHNRIYTQTPTGSRNGLENHMHTQHVCTCTLYVYICEVYNFCEFCTVLGGVF